jgi:carbamoyl-phosphate synthase large subunit
MKATGEVMAIGTTFEEAIMKAVRGAEIGHDSLIDKICRGQDTETIRRRLHDCTDERIFVVYEALSRGITTDEIHEITKIDHCFLSKLNNLVKMDAELSECKSLAKGIALAQGVALSQSVVPDAGLDNLTYMKAKRMGYPDKVIEKLTGLTITGRRNAVFKMVDTCAAEFSAETPYFYSTHDNVGEAAEFIKAKNSNKKTVIVFGSGPIRIGQGIEFDYASVHCVWALKNAGYDVVIVNNNPETVSTDFDTADRLYFEPLTTEDVWNIIRTEKPYGVVVAFGGQTAIKLTAFLDSMGVNILGTSADSIDAAEDRKRFDALLEELEVPTKANHPPYAI